MTHVSPHVEPNGTDANVHSFDDFCDRIMSDNKIPLIIKKFHYFFKNGAFALWLLFTKRCKLHPIFQEKIETRKDDCLPLSFFKCY